MAGFSRADAGIPDLPKIEKELGFSYVDALEVGRDIESNALYSRGGRKLPKYPDADGNHPDGDSEFNYWP